MCLLPGQLVLRMRVFKLVCTVPTTDVPTNGSTPTFRLPQLMCVEHPNADVDQYSQRCEACIREGRHPNLEEEYS